MEFWVTQTFNGISYGALLFLLGSGLSLIFGVMRIVNLSHGSYFLLGGYVALTVIWTTGSWYLAIPVAALTIAVVGLLMERLFLRPGGLEPVRPPTPRPRCGGGLQDRWVFSARPVLYDGTSRKDTP